jgi:hypothetical protein
MVCCADRAAVWFSVLCMVPIPPELVELAVVVIFKVVIVEFKVLESVLDILADIITGNMKMIKGIISMECCKAEQLVNNCLQCNLG